MSDVGHSPARKRSWILWAAFVAVIAIGGRLLWHSLQEEPYQLEHPETGFKFPPLDQISRVIVDKFYQSENSALTGAVAKEHWQGILNALQPSEVDPDPIAWEVMGEMTIETMDGRKIVIAFANSSGGGSFCVGDRPWARDRTYYLGGNSAQLRAALSEPALSLRQAPP
jgi:hypothetical protein